MWEEYTEIEKVYFPSDNSTYEFPKRGIRRKEDGFILMSDELRRDMEQTFICRGSFGEFRFFAQRWDSKTNSPTERYIVYITMFSPGWPNNAELNRKLVLEHAKDIEQALTHLPTEKVFNYIPIKEVLFE